MRYAIVSDIHANLTAWKTAMVDIADQKADTIICLGDVVGYGPNPVEVLESVYRHVKVTVMGNHDAAVCCKCDPIYFSDRAKTAVTRHQKLLSPQALIWLKKLPYIYQEKNFCCAHGDFSNPQVFNYIIEAESALPSWNARQEQLLFVGHSHLPGIYVLGTSGVPHFLSPCDFVLEEGKRYIVNPGSIGYPRSGDCHSTYCIYDTEMQAIMFREIPFDFTGYREAMAALGCAEEKWFLEKEEGHRVAEVREQPNFSRKKAIPSVQDKELSPPENQTQTLPSHSQSSKLKIKRLACLSGLLVGVLLLVLFFLLQSNGEKETRRLSKGEIPPFELSPLYAYPLTPPDKNLLPTWPITVQTGERLEGWRYTLIQPTEQRFIHSIIKGNLAIEHLSPQKIHIESPWIDLSATEMEAVRLKVSAFPEENFSGSVLGGIICSVRDPEGTFTPIKNEPFELRKKRKSENKIEFSRKVTIPKRTTHLQFFIDGEFSGQISFAPPYLGQDNVKKD